MKICVLGSEGQIGQSLCRLAKERGHKVDKIDLLLGNDLIYQDETQNVIYNTIDTSDLVYFLAFRIGGSPYLSKHQYSYQFIDDNCRIMVNTFETLKSCNSRFVFASSQMGNIPCPYGILKTLGEYYTKSLGGISTKFWNVYGVENNPNKTHVITDLIRKGLKTGNIEVNSTGNEQRQFLYSDDCSECLLKIAELYPHLKGGIVDISSFKWTSIKEVTEIISHQLGIPQSRINFKNDTVDIQQGIKNEPSKDILQFWEPKTPLEEGISKIISHEKNCII